jgi:hypothetical protein
VWHHFANIFSFQKMGVLFGIALQALSYAKRNKGALSGRVLIRALFLCPCDKIWNSGRGSGSILLPWVVGLDKAHQATNEPHHF